VTVPPASAVAPLSVAESCTVTPVFPADDDSKVAMLGPFGPTTTGSSSQPLLADGLFASPLNEATQ